MGKFTIERVAKVYDDDSAEYVYVGPDADGLDCVELRFYGDDGEIVTRLTPIPPEMAVEVAKAILELYGPKVASSISPTEWR